MASASRRQDTRGNSRYPTPLTPQELSQKKFSNAVVSKWLNEEEKSILCSVMESGDILEVDGPGLHHHWGIGLRQTGLETEGGNPVIDVVCLWPPGISSRREKQQEPKIVKKTLDKFWPTGAKIRINNHSDRSKPTHAEAEIRNQVEYALQSRGQKWHNCEHFAYWCRHGKLNNGRQRQATDVGVWGSLAATAGAWRFMHRRPRSNTE